MITFVRIAGTFPTWDALIALIARARDIGMSADVQKFVGVVR